MILIFLMLASLQTAHAGEIAKIKRVLLKFENLRVRHPIPGAAVTAGYGILINPNSKPVVVDRVSSKLASSIEMHESIVSDGQMEMNQLQSLEIPARGRIIFAPGGKHLMVYGLRTSLEKSIEIEFSFVGKKSVEVGKAVLFKE